MDKMPWEREGETFDAERAKTLLLNLRAEKEIYQAKLAPQLRASWHPNAA